MPCKNIIGKQVQRARYKLGWSQNDLATKLQIAGFDISRAGVSKIEAKLRVVRDGELLVISRVLRIPIEQLMPVNHSGINSSAYHSLLLTGEF